MDLIDVVEALVVEWLEHRDAPLEALRHGATVAVRAACIPNACGFETQQAVELPSATLAPIRHGTGLRHESEPCERAKAEPLTPYEG